MERKLKDVCDFYVGTGFPVKYQGKDNGELPFYKVGDIANNVNTRNVYLTLCNNYISKEEAKELKGKIVPPKTVVFAKIGEALKLNRRAITSQDCLIDNNVMGIAPRENELNLSYFFYYMKYLKMELLSESTAVPSVRKSMLEDAMIKVPSINVQAKTGKILDSVNEIIQLRKQQLTEYDQLIKSRFVEIFGDPILNPKDWDMEYLGDICDVRDGTHDSPKYVTDGFPLVTSKNVSSGYIDFSSVNMISEEDLTAINKRSKVDNGDIIMPMIGTVGNPIIVSTEKIFAIKNVALIKFKEKSLVNNVYIKAVLESEYFENAVSKNKRGGTQKFIALGDIRKFSIQVPKLDYQNEFMSFVQHVDKLKFSVQKSLDETQRLFDSLMQEYFG